jgi:hypothetical protein
MLKSRLRTKHFGLYQGFLGENGGLFGATLGFPASKWIKSWIFDDILVFSGEYYKGVLDFKIQDFRLKSTIFILLCSNRLSFAEVHYTILLHIVRGHRLLIIYMKKRTPYSFLNRRLITTFFISHPHP